MKLPISERHGKALSPGGVHPTGAPEWIAEHDNPYLQGLFAPVVDEVTADRLPVTGRIPPELFGAYFRNGPNNRHAPINRYHWFDGDGMVHGIWFEDGQARCANRWVRTPGERHELEAARAVWGGVLGPFDFSLPGGPLKDTANTDLLFFQGQLLALWYESGTPTALDPNTLDTLGPAAFAADLPGPVSAHSKVDPTTGDFVWFSYGDRPPYMRAGVVRPDGTMHSTVVDLPGPRRPHDIGVTPNYTIVHDFPVFFDPDLFERTGKRIPLFHPEVPTRMGLLERFGHDVQWFEFEPCYVLHVVDSWEDGDWVVMRGCRTRDPSLRPDPADGKLAAMLSGIKLQANLYEWRMNRVTGASSERDLDDTNLEFPTGHPGLIGQQNRYAYLQYIPYEIPATFDGLVKVDLQSGTLDRYDYGRGVFGSESPFVPRPGATTEDDGWVLSFVTDTSDWRSAVWIFDARDIAAGPVAKVHLPQRVPAGFHATWVDGADLAGA